MQTYHEFCRDTILAQRPKPHIARVNTRHVDAPADVGYVVCDNNGTTGWGHSVDMAWLSYEVAVQRGTRTVMRLRNEPFFLRLWSAMRDDKC